MLDDIGRQGKKDLAEARKWLITGGNMSLFTGFPNCAAEIPNPLVSLSSREMEIGLYVNMVPSWNYIDTDLFRLHPLLCDEQFMVGFANSGLPC
jgi:hypothetical protein